MKFLHSMIRVSDPAATVAFFQLLGLEERRRMENEAGRFTLIFLGVPEDDGGEVELTYNWDESGYSGGRNFGHLAYQVDNIYETCRRLMDAGVTINRPPRDGRMAFVRTPDDISIQLLREGAALAAADGVDLCVAAIDGGALGSLPCALLSPEQVRSQVAEVRSRARGPLN